MLRSTRVPVAVRQGFPVSAPIQFVKAVSDNVNDSLRRRVCGRVSSFERYISRGSRHFSTSGFWMNLKPVQFTSESHGIRRDDRFASVTVQDVAFFRAVVDSESGVIDAVSGSASEAELESYNVDWMRKYAGQSKVVVRPSTTEQVSRILAYCNDRKLAVVPQGGNTGLVGGSVPVFDEIVVSLTRMNDIRALDPVSGVIVAEAGVVLDTADRYLADKGLMFPLDLGAKGSCQLGGNVATNAGGLRLLRYGSLHGNVLGIEAVLPDGRIMNDLSVIRKNNTGYDLKQLFIGSEGTIGIITAVSVLCPARPKSVNVAFLALQTYEDVQKVYWEAKGCLSEIMTAFELMDGQSQKIVGQVTGVGGHDGGTPGVYPFYVLIETGGSNEDHDGEKLATFTDRVMEKNMVSDGTIAQDVTQAGRLWEYRERITECVGHWGGVYKYDVSIPIGSMYDIVPAARDRLEQAGLYVRSEGGSGEPGRVDSGGGVVVEVTGFGHMGDSNIHLNVAVREYDDRVRRVLEPWVYEWVSRKGGSISAEHGLGVQKRPYVGYSRPKEMIEMMQQVRKLYDPNGIMNPYKYV